MPAQPASELDLLARRSEVTRFAEPSPLDVLERLLVLVAEEGLGLMAPAAADDVRVSESGVRLEDRRGRFFFVRDQIFAA